VPAKIQPVKRTVRNLIVGKNTYIESWAEYRQVLLSGKYILIAILVCILYSILGLSREVYSTIPIYLCAIGVLLIALYLHRKGKHITANFILFPTVNLCLYLLASSEPYQTGAYLLFIPASLGAFAVFNYQQRLLAVSLAGLAYALFLMAYLGDFSILPKRTYTEEQWSINLILNFSVSLPTSILAIYLLISLNHHKGRELAISNKLLTKSNEELDRFVYSTSHDLRAPLTSIKGLINIMRNAKTIAEAQRYLGMMDKRIDSLDSFIKSITDYSRNNRLHISLGQVNVHALAQDIWHDLEYCPEAQVIEFKNEIPENLVIENDPGRLRMVLQNLISNAIRYHDKRKEYQYIRLYHNTTLVSISLHLEDNGQGIAPEIQHNVFDMFYRGNESSQGSGLGLYIVKETLDKLAGTIQLFSQPPEGTTFVVTLPAKG
jgi:signal transduction histidine kinase